MTIRFEPQAIDPGGAGAPGSRQDVAARQSRWMQELERAAFGARKAAAPVMPTASGVPFAVGPSATLARSVGSASGTPPTADRLPLATAQADHRSTASASMAPRSAGSVGTGAVGLHRASGNSATSAVSSVSQSAPDAAAQPASPQSAPKGLTLDRALDSALPAQAQTGLLISGIVHAAVFGATFAAAVAPAQAGVRVANVSTVLPPAGPMRLISAGPDPLTPTNASAMALPAEEDADSMPGRPSGPRAAEAEQYAATRMQLFRDGDAIHAVIRDAALAPEQAQRIGAAMANSIAVEGNRLSALTVNGKPVGLPGATDDTRADGDSAAQQPGAASSPSPSTTWYSKGATKA